MKTLLTLFLLIPSLSWGMSEKYKCFLYKETLKNGEVINYGGSSDINNLVYYIKVPLHKNHINTCLTRIFES